MKHIFLTLITLLFVYSCNSKSFDSNDVVIDAIRTISIIESEIINNEWTFLISPPKVGLISTKNRISEISDLLPINYSIKKDYIIFDDNDDDNSKLLIYKVLENNNTVFEIIPDSDNIDMIYSIVVLSPDYTILNTELRIGATLRELKNTFSIKDTYFNISDGLFIYCNKFDGAFSIDLEGEGDKYESLETLPDNRKIKAIIIY